MLDDLEIKLSHLLNSDKEETLKQLNDLGCTFVSSAPVLREYIKHAQDYKLNLLIDSDDQIFICKLMLGLAYSSIDEFNFMALKERYNQNINFSCRAYSLKRDEIMGLSQHINPIIKMLNNSDS